MQVQLLWGKMQLLYHVKAVFHLLLLNKDTIASALPEGEMAVPLFEGAIGPT